MECGQLDHRFDHGDRWVGNRWFDRQRHQSSARRLGFSRRQSEHKKVKYIPINWALIATPTNWIVVTLMVMIAGFGLALITSTPSSD
jgi:hypothetical protein